MNWKTRIPKCFSVDELVFGEHGRGRAEARKVMAEASDAGCSFKDVLAEAKAFLKSQKARRDHIQEQLSRMKEAENWFC